MDDNERTERDLNRAVTAADLGDFEWRQRAHPIADRLPESIHDEVPRLRRLYGAQWLFRFPNGYGASVCNGTAITAGMAPYEVALIRYVAAETGIDGDYELTGSVARGDLTWVLAELAAISEIPLSE